MAGKKRGKGKAGCSSRTKASSTAVDSGTGADSSTVAASGSSALLSSRAEDFPHVRVKIIYIEESFNLAIDFPLDQTFEGLISKAYKECARVYNETFRPSIPVSPRMLQLMPSGPMGDMSLREWCEGGFYLLCRFDPDIMGGLLWKKKLAEERNWKASFDGLLKAEKERVTPSSVVAPPVPRPSSSASFATDTKCRGCLVLTDRVSKLEGQIQIMQAQIAPLQAVVTKHNKVLRRMCLDAAKAKVVELVNVQLGNQSWRSYLKNLPQESISLIQPSLSEEAWHILDLGASPLNWAAHNVPLYEIASAILYAPERKIGWRELFELGFGKTAWDALAWEEIHDI